MLQDKPIFGFMLHDPINNFEEFMTGADLESLRMAQSNGCVFIAVYSDGERQIVEPEDVDFGLIGAGEGNINVMEQEYTVPIINAILELIEESYTPAVAVMTMTGAKKGIDNKLDNLKSLVDTMNDRYMPNIEGGE